MERINNTFKDNENIFTGLALKLFRETIQRSNTDICWQLPVLEAWFLHRERQVATCFGCFIYVFGTCGTKLNVVDHQRTFSSCDLDRWLLLTWRKPFTSFSPLVYDLGFTCLLVFNELNLISLLWIRYVPRLLWNEI